MKRTRFAGLLAAAVVGLAAAGNASAAIVYSFGTDQTSYTAPAGTPVTVKVYMKETVTSPDTSLLAPNREDGLASMGVNVSVKGAANGATITGYTPDITDFNGLTNNPANTATTARWNDTVAITAAHGQGFGNTGGGASPNTPSNEIYLGNVTITAGSAPTTFSVAEFAPNSADNATFNNSYDLDQGNSVAANGPIFSGTNANPFSFTVTATAVPEPVSLSGLGLVAAGLLARRRRS